MKKIYFLILFFLSILLFSQPVSRENALKEAKHFYFQKQSKKTFSEKDFRITYTASSLQKSSQNYYYIINVGDNEGFVIVSGDERVKTILGYSLTGYFEHKNLPDNLQNWLEQYEQQISYVIQNNLTEKPAKEIYSFTKNAVEVLPLIKTKWNQNKPYNNLCPTIDGKITYTGCVATATAQLMKYHEWPEKGIGSKTYTPSQVGYPITADFENTVYDWKNMKNVAHTEQEEEIVATLMYHVGVAVNMDYGTDESGAYSEDVPAALINYFGYDKNIQMHRRSSCDKVEWYKIIKDELVAKRPIYYAGRNLSGHAFICDGVDNQDYFHINWGWGGVSDGYFTLENLVPNSLGVGGGSGDYSYSQQIIVGIQRPTSESTNIGLYLKSNIVINKEIVARSESFEANYNIINRGVDAFTEKIGIGLYKKGELIQVLSKSQNLNLEPDLVSSNYSFQNVTIATDVVLGDYRLYAIAQKGADWVIMKGDSPKYLDVNITDSQIIFTKPQSVIDLSLVKLPEVDKFYQNKKNKFNFSVKNNEGEFFSKIYVQLVSSIGEGFALGSQQINLVKGETVNLEFITSEINVEEGFYTMQLFYYNKGEKKLFDFNKTVEVVNSPPGDIRIENIENPLGLFLNEKLEVKALVSNSGGYFAGTLICYVMLESNRSIYVSDSRNIIMSEGTSETFVFSPEISGLSPGDYYVFFNLREGESQKYLGSTKRIRLKEPVEIIERSLTLVKFPEVDKFYKGKDEENNFSFSIKNSGEDYHSEIKVRLTSNTERNIIIAEQAVDILNGEEMELVINPFLAVYPGFYTLEIYYLKEGKEIAMGASKEVQVIGGKLKINSISYKNEIYKNDDLFVWLGLANLADHSSGNLTFLVQSKSDEKEKITYDYSLKISPSILYISLNPETRSLKPGDYEVFITYTEGKYTSKVLDEDGVTEYKGNLKIIDSKDTEEPILSIKTIEYPAEIEKGTKVRISLDIKNEGGLYEDKLECIVKNSSGSKKISTQLRLEKDKVQTILFSPDTRYLSPGVYEVYLTYIDASGNEKILHKENIEYKGSLIIKEIIPEEPKLTLIKQPEIEKLYLNKENKINFSIKNEGSDYNSKIDLQLISLDGKKIILGSKKVEILENQTVELEYSPEIDLPLGLYTLNILYYKKELAVPFNFDKEVSVIDEFLPVILELESVVYPLEIALKENIQIETILKNKGGDYKGRISCFLRNQKTGALLTAVHNLSLENTKSKTVIFEVETEVLQSGDYVVYFTYEEMSGKKFLIFKEGKPYKGTLKINELEDMKGVVSEEEEYIECQVYPNPVIDNLKIKSSYRIKSVQLFTLSGKFVLESDKDKLNMKNLKSGIYIVRVITEKGVNKFKIIKN